MLLLTFCLQERLTWLYLDAKEVGKSLCLLSCFPVTILSYRSPAISATQILPVITAGIHKDEKLLDHV